MACLLGDSSEDEQGKEDEADIKLRPNINMKRTMVKIMRKWNADEDADGHEDGNDSGACDVP